MIRLDTQAYDSLLRFVAGLSLLLMAITSLFIWFYLMWIGRLDLFLKAVTFHQLFSFSGLIFLASVILFCTVLFIPCLLGCLVIYSNKNNVKSKKNRTSLVKLYALNALVFLIFISLMALFSIKGRNLIYLILMILTSASSVLIALISMRKQISSHLSSLKVWKKIKVLLVGYAMKPFILGILCWFIVLPMTLLIKFLHHDSTMNDYQQIALFLGFGTMIIILNLFPCAFFVSQDFSKGLLKPLIKTFGCLFLLLIIASAFIPVIPLLIVNFAFKMTGMTMIEPMTFALKTDEIPYEILKSKGWHYQVSEDKRFNLISGVIFFSYGNLVLVCPEKTVQTFRSSLVFDMMSDNIEKQARAGIKKSTQQCIVLDKEGM